MRAGLSIPLSFVAFSLVVAGCADGPLDPDTGTGRDVPGADVPALDGATEDGGGDPDGGGSADGGESDADRPDAGDCTSAAPDYSCTGPADCIGGTCIAGLCLGPDRDPSRWASCGDGTCGACEDDASCPADCGTFVRTALPTFDPSTTFTLKLHGLAVSTEGSLEDRTYGEAVAEGALEEALRRFAPGLPDGRLVPDAPNQLVAAEYYGTHAASWLTAAQVAEIEAFDRETPEALHRYALIVARFIEHRFELSGATHVAIVCHSMGCHVTRYLVEHDLLGLASSGRIARIVTQGGVLGGAALAELFDNPTLRDYAASQPFATTDFVHMHPDYVADVVARWDHRRHEANNPAWAGIYLHHVAGTNPVAGSTGLLRPLDLINPTDEPNDAILFVRDTFFHTMAVANQLVSPSGERLSPAVTHVHRNHPGIEPSLGAAAISAAGLYHRRRVTITLRDVVLRDDHERDSPLDVGTYGEAPADLVPEVTVRFDPYTSGAFGETEVVVNEQSQGARSAALFSMEEGNGTVDVVLFDGPIFDGQDRVHLTLDVREVDNYPHFGIVELPSGEGSSLATFTGDVMLTAGTFMVTGTDLDATVDVEIRDVY